MLKIKNFIFALSVSPVLSVICQLPNQAQTNPVSKITIIRNNINRSGPTAGTNSGAATGASQTGVFSSPNTLGNIIRVIIIPGVPAQITNGVSTTGDRTIKSIKVSVSAANTESTSPRVTVTDRVGGGSIVITLLPQARVSVNQLATAIIQGLRNTPGGGAAAIATLLTGGTGSQPAAAALTSSLTTAGTSPEQAQALVTALTGLFVSPIGSLPNLPVAQATSGQLVASNKILKPISVIAQTNTAPNVNINQLNDAIIAYNGIILQSEPDPVKKLGQDQDFVAIGKILKELRNSIQ
jgi:hypothetical protein